MTFRVEASSFVFPPTSLDREIKRWDETLTSYGTELDRLRNLGPNSLTFLGSRVDGVERLINRLETDGKTLNASDAKIKRLFAPRIAELKVKAVLLGESFGISHSSAERRVTKGPLERDMSTSTIGSLYGCVASGSGASYQGL